MQYGGALPMQEIGELIYRSFLLNASSANIQSGSLDLTPSNEFYRVRGSFLPSPDESVRDALKRVHALRIEPGSVLERGACYVARLNEVIARKLPDEMYVYSNPKSSSGRVDVHVRLLVDRVSQYDSIPPNYSGELWLLIAPKTFSIITPIDVPLNQARFFSQDTRLDRRRLNTCFEDDGGMLARSDGTMILYDELQHKKSDGSLLLTLGLEFETPGFEAISTGMTLDLSKKGVHDPREFFRPIRVSEKSLTLSANTFYILSTKEYVRVPEKFACEMAPMDEQSGELRSHYAGFIDPGWGIGKDGKGRGRPLTLEVRSFDNSIIIQDGQPIAKIWYERMIELPEEHYDKHAPNYGTQSGPQLSKHFLPWSA